jgi:hypothetical protein
MPKALVEFARKRTLDERRAKCAVCKLPRKVRDQMRDANKKSIPVPVIVEWLKTEHGVSITDDAVRGHARAQHDTLR